MPDDSNPYESGVRRIGKLRRPLLQGQAAELGEKSAAARAHGRGEVAGVVGE